MPKQSVTQGSKTLRDYWKPNDKRNAEHERELKQWLKSNAHGKDIATFIHSSAYDKMHSDAISALMK